MADRYNHGHHESVLRSHRWRTAENSAAHLLPVLEHGQRILDVGCGPGTITADLAERVAPGAVLGLDTSEAVLAQARAEFDVSNLEFIAGDVYDLSFDDEFFDVVHAHQVLQHLTDPVGALREMRRVLRPGGYLAVRDSDYPAFVWAPRDPRLDAWMQLYLDVTRANRTTPDAGRYLPGWVRSAGFSDVETTSSTWTFSSEKDRLWWGGLWADRIIESDFAHQALEFGFASSSDLEQIAQGFRSWAVDANGIFVIVHVEVLARR